MSNIRSIHFDLDGVLIDARNIHISALSKALSDYKINIPFEYQKELCGLPTLNKLEKISKEMHYIEKELYEKISEKKQDYTFTLLDEFLKYSEKFVDIFSKLQKEGFLLTVCSNSRISTIKLATKRLGINPFLSHTLSAESVKNPKPSPEMYLKSFEMLGMSSKECLIVEDSPYGILAAEKSNAGKIMIVESSLDVTYESVIQNINN